MPPVVERLIGVVVAIPVPDEVPPVEDVLPDDVDVRVDDEDDPVLVPNEDPVEPVDPVPNDVPVCADAI